MWILFAILSATFAALVTIFAKVGLTQIDPTVASIIRAVIMALALVLIGLSLKKFTGFDWSNLQSREWVYIILAGLAGALSWLFYFLALQSGPASAVAAIDKMSLVIIILMSALLLGDSFTYKTLLGIVMVTGGILFISFI